MKRLFACFLTAVLMMHAQVKLTGAGTKPAKPVPVLGPNTCRVQANDGTNTCTFNIAQAGSTLLGWTTEWNTNTTITSITAGCVSGNLSLDDNSIAVGGFSYSSSFHGTTTTEGSCTVTINYGSAPPHIQILIIEALNTTGVTDGHATSTTSCSTTNCITSTAITTATAGDFCFAGTSDGNFNGATFTAGSTIAWTLALTTTSGISGAVEYFIQAAAGSITATFTPSTSSTYPASITCVKRI